MHKSKIRYGGAVLPRVVHPCLSSKYIVWNDSSVIPYISPFQNIESPSKNRVIVVRHASFCSCEGCDYYSYRVLRYGYKQSSACFA